MGSYADAGVCVRRRRIGAAALVLAALTAGLATTAGGAGAALPNCGGNQNIQVAPVTCGNQRTIDGTTFSIVLDVTAAGVITVSYSLDAPRAADTPIRVRSHKGISSNPDVVEVSATIPAGSTSAVLSLQLMCGQIDVKAVFTGNGDARGRVGAPYVTTVNDCAATPPTTAPTTAPPTTGGTTPTTAGTTPSTGGQGAGGQGTTPAATGAGALPVTGSGLTLLVISLLLVSLGIVLVTTGRGRRTIQD